MVRLSAFLVLISVKSLSRPQGHKATGRIKSLKNSSDFIGNRTRDVPGCSAVPQPTAPPRTPGIKTMALFLWSPCFMYQSNECQGYDGVFAITDLNAGFVRFRRENEGIRRVYKCITGNRKGRAHNRRIAKKIRQRWWLWRNWDVGRVAS